MIPVLCFPRDAPFGQPLTLSAPEETREKLISRCSRLDNLRFQISRRPEILEQIFEKSDFQRLKKYRLVCRAWNDEICVSMKNCWLAPVRDSDEMSKLRAVLSGRRDSLRSSFESNKVVVASHLSPAMVGPLLGLQCWGFRITKLDLALDKTMIPDQEFQLLLLMLSPSLTHLRTNHRGSWGKSLPPPQFPHLQALFITVNFALPSPGCALFFVGMIARAPVLSILQVEDGRLARSILTGANNLSAIKRLDLQVSFADPDVWSLLERAGIRALEELTLDSLDGRAFGALSRFGSSLKVLKTRYRSPALTSLPHLPHLTTLELHSYSPAEMDLSSLPRLQKLIFNCINRSATTITSNGNGIPVSSSSVQSLTFRGHAVLVNGAQGSEFHPADSALFLELFKRFPKASTWEINYNHVVSFCAAVESTVGLIRVKSLTIIVVLGRSEPQDRHVFSYVECLRDLEELCLFHCGVKAWGYIRVEESSLKKIQSLKLFKIHSEYPNTFENYRFLRESGLSVVLSSPWAFNGSEDMLSFENFEFRSCSKDGDMGRGDAV